MRKIDSRQNSDMPNQENSLASEKGELVLEKKRGRGRMSKASQEGATSKKLGELNALLQKAAAYSTFLRERLLQSQKEALAARSNHTHEAHANSSAPVRDPRQPKLVRTVLFTSLCAWLASFAGTEHMSTSQES
jgi:hypothetical protein